MSPTPPAEGQGGDEVSKGEVAHSGEAFDAERAPAQQSEGEYDSSQGADAEAPDDPKAEQGTGAPAPGAAPTPGEAQAGPQTDVDADADHQATAATEQVETLHGCPLVDSLGAAVVHCDRARYGDLMAALKADGYDMFVGVCGVDYLSHPGRALPAGVAAERFEVVVELARVRDRSRLRVRCQVPDADPVVPSLFDLWAGSEAHEREVYDMYGITFAGHPDPSRILMPEDWEGHPLRKDYDSGRIPVQFKESTAGR